MEVLTRWPAEGEGKGGGGCQILDTQLEREEEEERVPGDSQMKRFLQRKGAVLPVYRQ